MNQRSTYLDRLQSELVAASVRLHGERARRRNIEHPELALGRAGDDAARLVHEQGAKRERTSRLARPGKRRSRRIPFAVGALALAGVIAAAVLTLTASTSPPAFAVIQHADGSVTLTIKEIAAINGANEELAKLGVRAVVAKIEPGCTATGVLVPGFSYRQGKEMLERVSQQQGGLSQVEWIIHPAAIPPGDTLSINAYQRGAVSEAGSLTEISGPVLYRGPAPACVPPRPSGTSEGG